jgi:hypothetical protein
MAILTKNQLSASNASSFPDNTTGAITPQILRDYNTNIIDTLVDSLVTSSYALTDATNNFTTEQDFTSISASSFVSASEFVGNGSKITGITASVALPILDEGILQGYATSMNFTGSAINAQVIAGTAVVRVNVEDAGFVLTSSFNAYTSSNDSKVNSLINATGSYAVSASVAAVDAAQQAQINSLINATGSFDNTSLNQFTASQETKDVTLLTYTASVDEKFSNIGAQSSSWDNTNLNAFTASQNTKNSTLATYTASVDTKFSNIGSQSGSWITESETGSFARTNTTNNFTGSQNFGDNINLVGVNQTIEGTSTLIVKGQSTILSTTGGDLQLSASAGLGNNVRVTGGNLIVNTNISASQVSASFFYGDGSNLTNLPGAVPLTSLNAFTASQETKNSTLASVTASLQQQLTNIGAQSGSWITESETGSFARTNVDNNFTANQTFTNITAVSASFQFVQTTYETSSVIYSSGSNVFGDAANDTQTLNGTVIVSGSQQITGSLGVNGITTISTTTGTPLIVDHKDATTQNTFIGFQKAGISKWDIGNNGGSDAFIVYNPNTFASPLTITQDNNVEILGALTASLTQGYTWVGNGSNVSTLVATSSFASLINTGSFATTGSNNFVGNQVLTGSLVISSSAAVDLTITGAVALTGNLVSSGSNGQATVSNIALSITANAQTSSATFGRNVITQASGSTRIGMAANPEQGNWISGLAKPSIFVSSGSISVNYAPIQFERGDAYTDGRVTFTRPVVLEQALTASLTEGYVWAGGVGNVTTLVATSSFISTPTDLSSLNAFTASQETKDSTLATYTASIDTKFSTLGGQSGSWITESETGSFATTGSNSFFGTNSFSGSTTFTGSVIGNVVSMSITSNTASMDFNKGNYFELTASVSPIRIEVSNLTGGVTSTLALNGFTSSAITWSANVLQPSGSAYTSSVSGSNDILSFVAFNSNKVNVVSTLKMI